VLLSRWSEKSCGDAWFCEPRVIDEFGCGFCTIIVPACRKGVMSKIKNIPVYSIQRSLPRMISSCSLASVLEIHFDDEVYRREVQIAIPLPFTEEEQVRPYRKVIDKGMELGKCRKTPNIDDLPCLALCSSSPADTHLLQTRLWTNT
jgi:hypothetical protein